ncbi:hypothetical protein [Arthrobacter sp. U41]|uniref:hypothetical protein n=1 Tax=Arthrobacter sp. U41 TaxID=1849032 RepID=UPI0008595791|nr:hypothetical protein [Arthrobacter sp. U41]AOT06016.1 hypothetical protein ASPU41_21560 [Arthrobacter sp. U41]
MKQHAGGVQGGVHPCRDGFGLPQRFPVQAGCDGGVGGEGRFREGHQQNDGPSLRAGEGRGAAGHCRSLRTIGDNRGKGAGR